VRRDPSLIPLSQQHHNGLALCVLTRRSVGSDSSVANCQRLARRIVDRYELELANHFELEESVLFPAIRTDIGNLTLVEVLVSEHREMERMVDNLRSGAVDQSQLEEFCSLLESHIRREERELFEDVQDKMRPETRTVLLEELNRRAIRICL
jgi:iron-sulfur cluster repair protein YtfE (RIC family)